jgi:uncharacterized protein (DUF2147 family)
MVGTKLQSKLVKTLAFLLFSLGLVTNVRATDPYGVWMRPSTGTQVNFYDCGGKLCGKIVAVKDPSRRSKVGTVILTGASQSGDNQWKGELLNADDGKTYKGVVTLSGPNALRLEGCVAFICQGETWSKVR